MNDTFDSLEREPASEPVAGPGRRLQEARQARGLSVAQVAQQLRLHESLVRALEQDAYDRLPEPIFVVGYIRQYARVVGLEPESLVDSYRRLGVAQAPHLERVDRVSRSGSPLGQWLGVALVAAVVIALFSAWWEPRSSQAPVDTAKTETPAADTGAEGEGQGTADADAGARASTPSAETQIEALSAPQGSSSSAPPTEVPPALDTPQGSQRVPSVAEGQDGSPPSPLPDNQDGGDPQVMAGPVTEQGQAAGGQTSQSASSTEISSETSQVSGEASAAADAGTSPPAANAGEQSSESVTMTLSFTAPSWVEITDANDKRLLYDLGRAGETHELEGVPPFEVLLGYSPGVRVEYNGEPFDQSPHSHQDVARFVLGDDEGGT